MINDNIIYIRVTQHQKHLVVDLLKENGVEVEYDDSMSANLFNVRVRIKTDTDGTELVPYEKIYTLTLKDLSEMVLSLTLEVFTDLSALINNPTRYLDPLYNALVPKTFDVSKSDTDIILKKNDEVIMKIPYSYTPLKTEGLV